MNKRMESYQPSAHRITVQSAYFDNSNIFLEANRITPIRSTRASDDHLRDGTHQSDKPTRSTKIYSPVFATFFERSACFVLTILFASIAGSAAAEEPSVPYRGPGEKSFRPRTFDKQITEKLGVSNVAYLLAVDVNGKVTPFIPDNSKASFRVIDPTHDKLTMDLFDIEPFTVIAGKRNPFCVIFVGGSGRKLWMESCP